VHLPVITPNGSPAEPSGTMARRYPAGTARCSTCGPGTCRGGTGVDYGLRNPHRVLYSFAAPPEEIGN
jgi:hypothetical protein